MNGDNPYKNNCYTHPELCGDNPAIHTVKRLGQSGLFLAAIAAYDVNLIINIIKALQPQNLDTKGAIIGALPQAIIFIGLLTFYLSCKTKKYNGVKPVGIQIVYITEWVLAAVYAFAFAAIVIQYIKTAANGDLTPFVNENFLRLNFEGYNLDYTNTAVIVTVGVIIAVVIAVLVLLYLWILKALGRIIKTIRSGRFAGKLPTGLAVMSILMASFDIVALFASGIGLQTVLVYLSDAAAYILFTLCLLKSNREMDALWYATEGSPLI